MILHPELLALAATNLLVTGVAGYASLQGWRIARRWDLSSGSEEQLELERRTPLVATLMAYALGFQLLSLFLFIHAAHAVHGLFTGAMCAAGSLQVNPYGLPALLLTGVNGLLAGCWLLLNHADSRGYDYPLTRLKYRLLALLLLPALLLQAACLFRYLAALNPQVITSCCGSLFGANAGTMSSELAAIPPGTSLALLGGALLATAASGVYFLRQGRGAPLFALTASFAFPAAGSALLSAICLYIYELPSHHCPFCLLQPEYHAVGYPLLVALMVAGISGPGVGILHPARRHVSLRTVIPALQRRLVQLCFGGYLLFALLSAWGIATSSLRLF